MAALINWVHSDSSGRMSHKSPSAHEARRHHSEDNPRRPYFSVNRPEAERRLTHQVCAVRFVGRSGHATERPNQRPSRPSLERLNHAAQRHSWMRPSSFFPFSSLSPSSRRLVRSRLATQRACRRPAPVDRQPYSDHAQHLAPRQPPSDLLEAHAWGSLEMSDDSFPVLWS